MLFYHIILYHQIHITETKDMNVGKLGKYLCKFYQLFRFNLYLLIWMSESEKSSFDKYRISIKATCYNNIHVII